jgi:hypothetical protein
MTNVFNFPEGAGAPTVTPDPADDHRISIE